MLLRMSLSNRLSTRYSNNRIRKARDETTRLGLSFFALLRAIFDAKSNICRVIVKKITCLKNTKYSVLHLTKTQNMV